MIDVRVMEKDEVLKFYFDCMQAVYNKYVRYCNDGGENGKLLYRMELDVMGGRM
jgi:hypothetical protein